MNDCKHTIQLIKTISKANKTYYYAKSSKREGRKTRISENKFYYLWSMADERSNIIENKNSYSVTCYYDSINFLTLTYK